MIRGPSYDDSYITRKMSHMAGPTFSAPARPPVSGYLQPAKKKKLARERRSLSPTIPWLWSDPDKYGKGWYRVDFGAERGSQLCYLPTARDRYNFLQSHAQPAPRAPYQPTRASSLPPPPTYRWPSHRFRVVRTRFPRYTYWYYPSLGPYSGRVWRPWTSSRSPSPVAVRARSLSPPVRLSTTWTGYHPLAPPPRLVHRLPPSYYDYDYGYGGYYGYVPPPPRMSRYDSYLDDDILEPTYIPRYHRPRLTDTLDDADYREKARVLTTTGEGNERTARPPSSSRVRSAGLHSLSSQDIVPAGEGEGERHLTRLQGHRYPTFSEPQMLQDHVDNMRIRLKSLAYSLDPSGPVPEIIVPDRPKKSSLAEDKKYSSGLEFTELPKLASRRQRYYPEDQHMKDNLRIQCLSHYKTTRTAADYWKPKQYIPTEPLKVMPESSRYNKYSSSKWEEPDTVFGAPSDKKPFSKVETGSSFFSTYGITNRKKDYVAEKVRDYYYFGDSAKDESGPKDQEVVQEQK